MKRRRALWLWVLLLCPFFVLVVHGEDGAVIPVGDAASLQGMAAHPHDSFVLTADIDMTGVDWTPFAFSGCLDGDGHTIYNLTVCTPGEDKTYTVDGNLKYYSTVGAGLFSTLSEATITNLTLLNIRVEIETEENCFAAPFAGCISSSEFRNCRALGSVQLISSSRMDGVGGIAGFGVGNFQDCSADVTLVHVDRTTDNCEQYTGGILGCGYASIERCRVNIAGYASCHGHVHAGGLVGMHYQFFDPANPLLRHCRENQVTGYIEFFEDTYNRRAYCAAYCGENLMRTLLIQDNEEDFERREVYAYDRELYPHSCSAPHYTAQVTAAGCSDFGYTTYTCDSCGYSYTDGYTAPCHSPGEWEVLQDATDSESGERVRRCTVCGAELERQELPPHVPGEWEVAATADYGVPGLEQRRCLDCGAVLETRELPALVRSEMIILEQDVTLRYKGTSQLTAALLPENADNDEVQWSSGDISVAAVDANGRLYARGIGSTVITCAAADGGAQAQCTVTVRYSFGQQLIRIFLLGFLWY